MSFSCSKFKKKKAKRQREGKGAEGREPTGEMGTEEDLFSGILKSAHFWRVTAEIAPEQI